jgi:hypothetical protein
MVIILQCSIRVLDALSIAPYNASMKRPKKHPNIESLSDLLNIPAWNAAILLKELGIEIDVSTGTFNPQQFVNALRRFRTLSREAVGTLSIAEGTATPSPSANQFKNAKKWNAEKEEIIAQARDKLAERLMSFGLKPETTKSLRTPGDTYRRPDHKTVCILTYVARTINRFDQVSFSVNHLDNDNIHWVALIAIPFCKEYLFRRGELEKANKDPKKPYSLTIRRGTPDTCLFENRIGDLVYGRLQLEA